MSFLNLIDKEDLDTFFSKIKDFFARATHNHEPLTVHDAVGGDKVYDGSQAVEVMALKGEDGYSPTIDVEEGDGKHTLTIKDKQGTQTVEILDGAGGSGGSVDASASNYKVAQFTVGDQTISVMGGVNGDYAGYSRLYSDNSGNLYTDISKQIMPLPYLTVKVNNVAKSIMPTGLTAVGSSIDNESGAYAVNVVYPIWTKVSSASSPDTASFPIAREGFMLTDSDVGKHLKIVCPVTTNQSTWKTIEFDIPSKEWILANAGGGGGASGPHYCGSATWQIDEIPTYTTMDIDSDSTNYEAVVNVSYRLKGESNLGIYDDCYYARLAEGGRSKHVQGDVMVDGGKVELNLRNNGLSISVTHLDTCTYKGYEIAEVTVRLYQLEGYES